MRRTPFILRASATSSTTSGKTASPKAGLVSHIVALHNCIVRTFGWRIIIGTPLVSGGVWGSYYYVYHYRPSRLMMARRGIPDTPPVRKTRVFVSGGENGTGNTEYSDGVVDAAIASHSKVPDLQDPRSEVGLIDNSLTERWRFQAAVILRGLHVTLYAAPVMALFVLSYFGFVEFQRACDSLYSTLCSLGPTFIKLGQWMATRPDLFPDEVCATLSHLYDSAPAHSWEQTLAILASTRVSLDELGADIREKETESARDDSDTGGRASCTSSTTNVLDVLAKIDKVPLNSGSVAQVYRATLSRDIAPMKKGDEVAIKVLHPRVRDIIWTDVCVLKLACSFINSVVPTGRYLDPLVHWYEFASFLISQLNLEREADNLDQFRYNFRKFPLIEFPRPLRALTSPDVLVESFEHGYPLKKAPRVSRSMADRGVHIFLKMLFQDNFVHADLHPGNIFLRKRNCDDTLDPIEFTADGEIAPETTTLNELVILDPGLVTSLSPKDRENFILLFSSVACGDSDLASRLMVERSPSQSCQDLKQFQSDMADVFALVSPKTEKNQELLERGQQTFRLSEVRLGEVLMGLFMTLRKYKISIDGNFATLIMSAVVGEGMGRAMNPDFNIFAAAAPFLAMSLKGHELQQLVTQLQSKYGISVVVDLLPAVY